MAQNLMLRIKDQTGSDYFRAEETGVGREGAFRSGWPLENMPQCVTAMESHLRGRHTKPSTVHCINEKNLGGHFSAVGE